MKTTNTITTLLLATVISAEEAKETILPIEGVTLYEDRALIDRSGEVSLVAGINQLTIAGLPVSLQEPSLRASVGAATGAKILSVSSRTEQKLETQDERLRALEKADDELDRSISKLQSKMSVINDQETYLRSFEQVILRSLSERTTLGTVKPQEINSTSGFLTDRRTTLANSRRDLSNQLTELKKKKTESKNKIRQLTRPNKKTVRYAEITLSSPAAKKVDLNLSYLISNASWKPRYEAHLTDGQLEVQYLGEVRQRTGEDWKDVAITLSTARPSLGARRPKLVPLRMYLVTTSGGQRKKVVSVSGGEEDASTDGEPEPPVPDAPPVAAEEVQVAERGTSVVFELPGTSTVPSDRRSYKLPIMSFTDDKPGLSFESTPKLLRYVYLKCKTTNKTRFPLLAGPVDIFRQSGFMGTSSLKFVAPGKKVELSFGIDEDLKIIRRRDPGSTFSKKSGRKVTHHFAFDTEVANYKETDQKVTVIDNYPVSDLEEVAVELSPLTTRPDRHLQKKGRLEWDVSLKPGEKRVIHLKYEVTLPKDFRWQVANPVPDAMPQE